MTGRAAGRPRAFDRDDALRQAAHLFWRYGFSGTTTRMLTACVGISSSSLYAAFGTKSALFEEAVRTYAKRYSTIYDRALQESTIDAVIERLFVESVTEFTRTAEGHPGCLTTSAVMSDSSATLDVREYVIELQRSDQQRLLDRLEQAAEEGMFADSVGPAALAELIHTIWQGLSTRAELGASRAELLSAAALAATCIAGTMNTVVNFRSEAYG